MLFDYQMLLIQGIGIIGLLIFLMSFQSKSRQGILFFQMASYLVYVVHFFLLGAMTAAAIFTLCALKNYVFSFKGKKKWADSPWLLIGFLAAFVISGLLTWEGYHSLLGIAAVIFVTLSHWSQETKKLRILFAFSNPLWFIYDIFVGSYAGMISEILIFTSNVIGYYRNERK